MDQSSIEIKKKNPAWLHVTMVAKKQHYSRTARHALLDRTAHGPLRLSTANCPSFKAFCLWHASSRLSLDRRLRTLARWHCLCMQASLGIDPEDPRNQFPIL